MRFVLWLAIVICFGGGQPVQPGAPGPPERGDWGALQYLLGDWTGEGSGETGQGTGSFSFQADLQGKILVRKNHAEYPATKERAAFEHDDLMIVYREPPDNRLHAVYFDNEQHAIRYEVEEPAGGDIVFLSAPEPSAPRYRLTYIRLDAARMKIRFEIAPPGHPEQFATYIEASARRAAH